MAVKQPTWHLRPGGGLTTSPVLCQGGGGRGPRGRGRLEAQNQELVARLEAEKAALERHFPGRPPVLVLGMLADKEWQRMACELVPVASRVITVPVSSQRAVSSADLRAACMASGVTRPVRAVESLAEGLRACAADPFVVVTGSLALVGEALECLGEARPVPGHRELNEWSPPKTPPT